MTIYARADDGDRRTPQSPPLDPRDDAFRAGYYKGVRDTAYAVTRGHTLQQLDDWVRMLRSWRHGVRPNRPPPTLRREPQP